MRRALVVAGTLAGASVLAQFLDHDPIPPAVISLMWVVASGLVVVALVGIATLRRAASQRPVAAGAIMALTVTSIVILAVAPTSRLSTLSTVQPSEPLWTTVQSPEAALPLGPTARELMLALQAASNHEYLDGCAALLGPGDVLGPRTLVQVGELISSPRVTVVPELTRLRDAVRAMERVDTVRQVNRSVPSSSEEQRLVMIYDWILLRAWILSRERRPPVGKELGPAPLMCAYGLVDLSPKPVLKEYELALHKLTGL
jgi:hypothetical protein